jgi:alkylresorcinol/alkylpyrone synthase
MPPPAKLLVAFSALGLPMRPLPRLAAAELGRVIGNFLGRQGLTLDDIGRFVCHPGGPKVIDAYENVLGVGFPGTTEARLSSRDYGNMSAASVMFVLEHMLNSSLVPGEQWGPALLTALGPGFTAGFVVLA